MDQYEDYYRLPLLLKRFRFGDKMSRLFYMLHTPPKLSGKTGEVEHRFR